MSLFGLVVVYTIAWWMAFFALLPLGVRRPGADELEPGQEPGAPVKPWLWHKAGAATLISVLLVGGIYLADDRGWIDFRGLIYGEGL